MLEEWNATASPFPRTCVDVLVAEQAKRSPDAVAVECDDERLTFAELERRASSLASYLRRLGVGPEVLVGIASSARCEMLVGLLGILKAGGAYVPLDPAYPGRAAGLHARRRRRRRCSSRRSGCCDRLPVGDGASGLPRPRLGGDRAHTRVGRDARAASREQLAYVIYTSGSTGRPKGVEIPHRALVNFLVVDARAPGPGDRTTCSSR